MKSGLLPSPHCSFSGWSQCHSSAHFGNIQGPQFESCCQPHCFPLGRVSTQVYTWKGSYFLFLWWLPLYFSPFSLLLILSHSTPTLHQFPFAIIILGSRQSSTHSFVQHCLFYTHSLRSSGAAIMSKVNVANLYDAYSLVRQTNKYTGNLIQNNTNQKELCIEHTVGIPNLHLGNENASQRKCLYWH